MCEFDGHSEHTDEMMLGTIQIRMIYTHTGSGAAHMIPDLI